MKMKRGLLAGLMVLGMGVFAAPGTIVYQGRLLDADGNVVNSPGLAMKFLVYSDLTGGTLLYQDWHDGSDSDHALVAVTDGLYKAALGDDTTNHGGASFTSLTDALGSDDSVYLEISIGASTLSPREKFQAVPYAISSGSSSASNATRELNNLQNTAVNADIVPATNNAVDLGSSSKQWRNLYVSGNISDGTNNIALGNVATLNTAQTLTNKTINPANNTVSLADGKVLIGNASGAATAQTIGGAVTISNAGVASIAANAVVLGTNTTGNYVESVTAGNGLSGDAAGEGSAATLSVNVDNSTLAISSDNLIVKDAGVTAAKIADGAVSTAKIADAAVTNAKLENSAVTVTAGDGLKDGGAVALGSAVTVNVDPGDGMQIASDKVAVDNTVVRTTGAQTLTGVKTFGSIPVLPGANPTNDNEAVRKAYVDGLVNGVTWKNAVKAATTANISLSGTQTLDGVAVAAGDRVLVKDQTATEDNGIYVVASGAWSRAEDMNAADEVKASAVFITDGSTLSGTAWVCNNAGTIVLDTTGISFAQFSGTGTYTAGAGLTLTGNVFAVGAGTSSGITANADDIQVNVDGSTLEISGNALRVKDAAVSAAKIADGAITSAKIADLAVTNGKIAANAVTSDKIAAGAVGTLDMADAAVTTDKLDDEAVTVDKIADTAITAAKISDGAVSTAKIADSAVTAAKIADDSITNAAINASAAIADTKLAQLTTANKVAGSAVQLSSTGGIQNNSGLQIKQATGSGLTVDANGVRVTVCNKLDATAAPAKTNDLNDTAAPNGIGYAVGSVWIDTTAKRTYVCVSAADGAAVWRATAAIEAQTSSSATYSNRSLGSWL